jgi:alanine racemase
MNNTARAVINLGAIKQNLNLVKHLAPRSKVLAMVKADAYGHGLVPVAKALSAADGLAVARLQEALTLRAEGIKQRLVVMGTLLSEQELQSCQQQNIDIVIHSQKGLETLLQIDLPEPINVWLKVDTGMHRLGVAPEQFTETFQQLQQSSNVAEIIAMTHLSCADQIADPSTPQQLACFDEVTRDLPIAKSVANSAALIRYQQCHYDWVRPGIMLYGADPLQEGSCLPLTPAMTLTATIVAIRDIDEQQAVGYGLTWQADSPTRLATVGIGYGDGYPRHIHNNAPVMVNQQIALVAGRVSMDLLTLDISHCSGVAVGDEVVLWNEQLKANEIARSAGTISYELFTSVTQRVERCYK